MKTSFLFSMLFLSFISCNNISKKSSDEPIFKIENVKPIIKEHSKKWNEGLKNKDLKIFLELYDDNAHYLPNEDIAIHGNRNIAEYWKNSWNFITNLQLNMETLEGTKNVLYETGNGVVSIKNENDSIVAFPFKYVNVWKLQPNKTYKVVIDTYNSLKNNQK